MRERPVVIRKIGANDICAKQCHVPNREDQRVPKALTTLRSGTRREVDKRNLSKPKKETVLGFDEYRAGIVRIKQIEQRSNRSQPNRSEEQSSDFDMLNQLTIKDRRQDRARTAENS